MRKMFNLFFGCRHRRITRPITPARKSRAEAATTYVACLDCGQQLTYNLATMTVGRAMTSPCPQDRFQTPN
jgi:hypothetical protein